MADTVVVTSRIGLVVIAKGVSRLSSIKVDAGDDEVVVQVVVFDDEGSATRVAADHIGALDVAAVVIDDEDIATDVAGERGSAVESWCIGVGGDQREGIVAFALAVAVWSASIIEAVDFLEEAGFTGDGHVSHGCQGGNESKIFDHDERRGSSELFALVFVLC